VQVPQNGGCLCGALRYEITRMPIAVYTCHCTNCQRLLGSAFSMSFIVADEAFHHSGGRSAADPAHYRLRTYCDPVDLPRMRHDHLQRTKVWLAISNCVSRCAGRHAGRHLLAATDGSFLDTQRAALGRAAFRWTEVRDTASGHYGVLVIAAGGGPRLLNPPMPCPGSQSCAPCGKTRDTALPNNVRR